MKKILGLTVAALLVMGLVGGGTWAYFTDVETSTGNVLTAGTLNLTADVLGGGTVTGTLTPGADGANEYITLDNLKPSDSGNITFTCTNTGNLPGTLDITCTVVTTDNSATEPETNASTTNDVGGDGDLDEYLGVWLTQDINGAGATDKLGASGQLVPLEGLAAVLDAVSEAMTAGGDIVYVLSWEIEADAGAVGVNGYFEDPDVDDVDIDDNVLQSDTATINLTFTLTQS